MAERFRHTEDDQHGHLLWAGTRAYPVVEWNSSGLHTDEPYVVDYEYRRAVVPLENRWMLSTIWGDCTYSDNYGWPRRLPFNDEPFEVEVGVLTPGGGLWSGVPLSYVDVPAYHVLVDGVSRLPSSGWPPAPEGGFADAHAVFSYVEMCGMIHEA